jgi:hypothetical protein
VLYIRNNLYKGQNKTAQIKNKPELPPRVGGLSGSRVFLVKVRISVNLRIEGFGLG